jgi:copper homeostasis protein (lipoprotein)
MTLRNYVIAALLLALWSCNYSNPDQIVTYDTIPSTDAGTTRISEPNLVFSGKLPCADCGGIETVLTFIPDSMTYRMKETYLNTGEGDKVFESNGTYAVNRGTVQDSGAGVYLLNPGDAEKSRAFKQETDSAIRMLDRNLNEFQSALNYYLVRVADTTATQ